MAVPGSTPATIADRLAIPEAQRRHELIDGVLVEKEAASGRHGGAQVRLSRRLGPYDRRPGGRWPGGWWFALAVHRWHPDGYVEVLVADRTERVRAEPFDDDDE